MKIECPPVLICGFNRPECLRKVFDAVRQVKPRQLFLALDAPREGRPTDVPRCEECKRIYGQVDWSCEVHRDYAKSNMGCRNRMASAITWTFEYVDRAIILEDDCVPDLTFFRFCDELLERYKDDNRVGLIAGHIQHPSHYDNRPEFYGSDSYYFDYMNTIWGWATWRRAWNAFVPDLDFWPEFVSSGGLDVVSSKRRVVKCFRRLVENTLCGRTSSWAIIWWACCVRSGMMCLHPVSNLISNIGFGDGATHTLGGGQSEWANLPAQPMAWPLKHPSDVSLNKNSQQDVLDKMYAVPLLSRVVSRIKRMIDA